MANLLLVDGQTNFEPASTPPSEGAIMIEFTSNSMAYLGDILLGYANADREYDGVALQNIKPTSAAALESIGWKRAPDGITWVADNDLVLRTLEAEFGEVSLENDDLYLEGYIRTEEGLYPVYGSDFFN